MKKYKTAIIGTGRVAGDLELDKLREHPCTHAGFYKYHKQTKTVACASPDLNNVESFAKTWKIPSFYTNYKEMLLNEDIDILSICTPAPYHSDVVLNAVKSGVKSIICEKPMCISIKQANSILRACKRNNVQLTVNHLRRWGWDWQAIKKLIDKEKIGIIQTVSAHFSGNIMHTGTHMFDILRFLFGEVRYVQGKISKSKIYDTSGYKFTKKTDVKYEDPDVTGTLFFKNGVEAFINGKSKSYFIFEMDIIGSNGRIKMGNHLLELWKPHDSNFYSSFTDLIKVTFPLPKRRPNPWKSLINNIVSSLNNETQTLSTGIDGKKAMEIGFALIESSKQNRAKVTLPLKNSKEIIYAK